MRCIALFMCAYTAKHPDQRDAMLAYQFNIFEYMSRGFDWYAYDKKFRHEKEHCSSFPWDVVRFDLERDAYYLGLARQKIKVNLKASGSTYSVFKGKQPPNKDGANSGSKGSNTNQKRPAVCYKFNDKDAYCDGPCRYKHACRECGGNHPAYVHDEKSKAGTQNQRPGGSSGDSSARR